MKKDGRNFDHPFIFILGCGRSGTTLLRSMFDSHPQMAIPGESGFLWRHRRRYEKGTMFDIELFIDDLTSHRRFHRWGLSREHLMDSLATSSPRDHAEAVRRLYGLYAASRGKHRFGDKTPNHVLQVAALAEQFPEARFIHLIRDGRNVALSYLDIKEWGPSSVTEVGLYWKRRVQEGRRQGTRLGPERYTEVHYEELIDDPEQQLRRLCDFSLLAFDEAMLLYFERASEALKLEFHPHRHSGLRKPPTKDLRDWRTKMTADQIACFEAVAGDALTEFGYERRLARPLTAVFPKVAWDVGGLGLRRIARLGRGASRRLRQPMMKSSSAGSRAHQ